MVADAWIEGLSIALFGRWDGEKVFVILTSRGDESGTHGGAPVTIVAAAFGGARQWKNFQRAFDKLRKKYKFTIYHSKKLADSDGEFASLSRIDKYNLVSEFADIVDDTLTGAYITSLREDDYRNHYLGDRRGVKGKWDSKYGICFRVMASALLEETRVRKHKKGSQLHIIMESGARNARNAVEIFDWMKSHSPPEYENLLGTLTFDKKQDCPLLGVGDFLATTLYLHMVDKERPVAERRLTGESRELKSNISLIETGPEQCAALRAQAMLTHRARMRRVNPVLSVERGV